MKLMTNQIQKLGIMFTQFISIEQTGRSKHKYSHQTLGNMRYATTHMDAHDIKESYSAKHEFMIKEN